MWYSTFIDLFHVPCREEFISRDMKYICIFYNPSTLRWRCNWNPSSLKTRTHLSCKVNTMDADNLAHPETRALSYYSDLTLSQSFQPMGAKLSKKAVLQLVKLLATASHRSSKTGAKTPAAIVLTYFSRNILASVQEWLNSVKRRAF